MIETVGISTGLIGDLGFTTYRNRVVVCADVAEGTEQLRRHLCGRGLAGE